MIEVGEYVRTKKGFIGKLIDIDENNEAYYLDCKKCISLINIVKRSKNIIDLIEVGDYVNGHRILEIHEALAPDDEKILDTGYGMAIFADSIETILTKEMFEANCYKVKEE